MRASDKPHSETPSSHSQMILIDYATNLFNKREWVARRWRGKETCLTSLWRGETSTNPYTTVRTRPDEEDKGGKGAFAGDRLKQRAYQTKGSSNKWLIKQRGHV